jgi:hypothetical protein
MVEYSAQECFKYMKTKVFETKGRRLNEVETVVIKGTLEGKTYKEIAASSDYSYNYLHHDVGPQILTMLREVLGRSNPGIDIELQSKRRFLAIIQRIMTAEAEGTLLTTHPSSKLIQGQLPDVSVFFGRSEELDRLAELSESHRCVSVLGGAGIGKSALVSKLLQDIPMLFSRYIWQPLRHTPAPQTLLNNLVSCFEPNSRQGGNFDSKMQQLLRHLRATRTLIIFDSAECMHQRGQVEEGEPRTQEKDSFAQLLRMLATEDHQSCIVLTSREPVTELMKLQAAGHLCKHIRLRGLDTQSCVDLLVNQGISSKEELLPIILRYRSEPLDLKLTASYIQNYCGGSVSQFLSYDTTLMSDVREESLNRLFAPDGQLSPLERAILIYISTKTEKTGAAMRWEEILTFLEDSLSGHSSMTSVVKALEFLNDCSLLEKTKDANTSENFYEVQPTIQKYIRVDPSGYITYSRTLLQMSA